MKKDCFICKNNINFIDYKNTQLLRRFLTPQAKIASRRRTGNCAFHQRKVAKAVKKARNFGLTPFTTRTLR